MFKPSDSPYGTYDHGGNVYEWMEAYDTAAWRRFAGGAYHTNDWFLNGELWATLFSDVPTRSTGDQGLRIVEVVPEPASALLLLFGLLALPFVIRRNR